MAEEERLIEFRVARVEVDVRDLRTDVTSMRECQIKTNSSLDNLLIGFGELKGSITSLTSKPGKNWEKMISAGIGAGVALFFSLAGQFIFK
jgi:hypothetical protein